MAFATLPPLDDYPRAWRDSAERSLAALSRPPAAPEAAIRVLALSEFARRVLVWHPQWCAQALAQDTFARPPDLTAMRSAVRSACAAADNMAALQCVLRCWRNRYQLWIVYRHLCGWAPLEETTASLSALADVCIDQALVRVHAWEVSNRGQPVGAQSAAPQQLVVLALGKLGANELNLSSDVDLILLYPEAGAAASNCTNQQFFVRVGQRLVEALDRVTADGFAFRVDLRLRPYGDSGPLAMHFAAAEAYYASAGRDWERYAFIKARPCAGDLAAGAQFLTTLQRFVYRRYLDFGALEALRVMKAQLARERNNPADLKLGPGGIRDAEFTVQLHQLIWGGREPRLQHRALLAVVPELVATRLLPNATAQTLLAGYRFLRNLEHCLQAFADQQTQVLPVSLAATGGVANVKATGSAVQSSADKVDLELLRLALAMGHTRVESLATQLQQHRSCISELFMQLLSPLDAAEAETWDGMPPVELGHFRQPEAAAAGLEQLWFLVNRPSVAAEGRERLQQLMPRVLAALISLDDPDAALANLLPVLRAVLRRSAYLVLLFENPAALDRLLRVCQDSRWLAGRLARMPLFLDALLDQRQQETVPDAVSLHTLLVKRLRDADSLDSEHWLDEIREFKELHGFQAALGQVLGHLPLMRTSDYLTFTAQAVLQEALALAWRTTARDAQPWSAADVAGYVPEGFAILGFGKLGGIELGPASDLDLVFVHDLDAQHGPFLHRMVRKLMSYLTLPAQLGPLFAIDTRLRPAGRAGSIVTNPAALARYYAQTAWTWELQALVRARPVAGDGALCARFDQLRREVLCQPRDVQTLRAEISRMRERLRLAKAIDSAADLLKQERGGLVDIEFMVQYLVLAHAYEVVELAGFSDNVRLLEVAAQAGLLSDHLAAGLREAYLALRVESHRNQLDLADERSARAVFAQHQPLVSQAWESLLGA